MASVSSMPLRHCNAANEERSSYFPQGSITGPGRGSNGNVRGAFGQGKNFSPAKNNQRRDNNNQNIGSGVVQMRDEHSSGGLASNRHAKQLRKEESLLLKRLNTGASISGFIKPLDSQVSWIDGLGYEGNAAKKENLNPISASQVQRQDEELEEID